MLQPPWAASRTTPRPRGLPSGARPTPHSYIASDVDARAEQDRVVARQVEELGGVGGDAGGREEQALAPAAHAGLRADAEVDRREEVRRAVDFERALDLRGVDQAQHGGDV